MVSLLGFAVFGSAFLLAIWTMVASVRPQMHRLAVLFGAAEAIPALPPAPRPTVRGVPVRLHQAPGSLRAAA